MSIIIELKERNQTLKEALESLRSALKVYSMEACAASLALPVGMAGHLFMRTRTTIGLSLRRRCCFQPRCAKNMHVDNSALKKRWSSYIYQLRKLVVTV